MSLLLTVTDNALPGSSDGMMPVAISLIFLTESLDRK